MRVAIVFVAAVAAVTTVTSAPNAFACSCVAPTEQPLTKAGAVYIASPIDAEVERIDAAIPADGRERVVLVPFAVQRVLKGTPVSTVSVRVTRRNDPPNVENSCGVEALDQDAYVIVVGSGGQPPSFGICDRYARPSVEGAVQELGPGEPVAALTSPARTDPGDGSSTGIVALAVAAGAFGGFLLGRRRASTTGLVKRGARLVIAPSGSEITDDQVQGLRGTDQR